jgi:transcriptional regulator PpsR
MVGKRPSWQRIFSQHASYALDLPLSCSLGPQPHEEKTDVSGGNSAPQSKQYRPPFLSPSPALRPMSRGAKPTSPDAPLLPRELDSTQAQRLIDAAADIALVLDGDGVVLDVRAHDRELLKTARRAWVGRALVDTVTIECRAKVAELVAAALADEPSLPRQLNHPAASGPDLPVLYTAARVGGAVRGPRASMRVLALGRDLRDNVTLQRRLVDAQQTMERDYWRFREADTRYRNLFKISAEAVLVADGTTLRIVEANPAALMLLAGGSGAGKDPKVVGAALASLFAADAAESLASAVAAARSLGKHERLSTSLAATKLGVAVSLAAFRQEQASFLLVRLAPLAAAEPRQGKGQSRAGGKDAPSESADFEAAFFRSASDALAFTDGAGRVVAVNRAFVRLAQLSSEEQARGEPLDSWLGRTGVEMSVLLANLRDSGAAGLFSTELRGALGLVTEVEIAASAFDAAGGPGAAAFAFAVRDVGRRLAPNARALPTKVPASVAQLTELVGRVPLKQIVAETSDLIERLSIETALTMTKDNRAMAAQLLGLSRQSLYVKLRRFGMGGLDTGDAELH